MMDWFEFAAVWTLFRVMALLPREVARHIAAILASFFYSVLPKLRKTAEFNLNLAFPEKTEAERARIIRSMLRNFGWMAAEFARLPKLSPANVEKLVVLDGHEHFLDAQRRGKGVLVLTGHIGAWELSSFAHAVYGYPIHYIARPLDNRRIDAFINHYRSLSGNRPIFKNESARAMLKALKNSESVGILADQNTMPGEGAFVDFFGVPACTTTGLARIALHTDAAVVPGYAVWDEALGKYRLRFEPRVELLRSGDMERDILENTQRFTRVLEDIIRAYPDQWVWIHARWKNPPPGEPKLYPFL